MDLRTYSVEITGVTPLIMHWDNIAWSDAMDAWRMDPKNKKFSKAGDDRTPSWKWLGCMYHDGQHVALPQDNLMRALMEGGAMVLVPGGKMGKSFKQQTQSGLIVTEPFWPVSVRGANIPIDPFKRLAWDASVSFADHEAKARSSGFELFLKRAKIGSAKHVRVRPLFSEWSVAGTIQVMDAQITTDVLQDVLSMAGTYKGLGDWRPSGKTPGPYGRFTATVEDVSRKAAA